MCPLPYARINNVCLQCPSLSNNQNGQCVCQPGYILNTTSVTCQRVCQANAALNSQGNCECITGYSLTGGVCVALPSCASGQTWNGAECVCEVGQFKDKFSNGCTYCNTPDRAV